MDKNELMKLAIERLNKPSKLTSEQVEHFKKTGMFTATYSPTKLDISGRLLSLVGKRVTIFRSYELSPCVDAPAFFGQYKFFIEGYKSCGWCPESDFTDILILPNNFADEDEVSYWEANHQYALVYTDRKSCIQNFGEFGEKCELPFVIGRSYDMEQHDYILNKLSDPKADLVLYRDYPGEWVEIS